MEPQPTPRVNHQSKNVLKELDDSSGVLEISEAALSFLRQRVAIGIQTYGQPLYTHNGRDARRDCVEELADATLYAFQMYLESEGKSYKERRKLFNVYQSVQAVYELMLEGILNSERQTRRMAE